MLSKPYNPAIVKTLDCVIQEMIECVPIGYRSIGRKFYLVRPFRRATQSRRHARVVRGHASPGKILKAKRSLMYSDVFMFARTFSNCKIFLCPWKWGKPPQKAISFFIFGRKFGSAMAPSLPMALGYFKWHVLVLLKTGVTRNSRSNPCKAKQTLVLRETTLSCMAAFRFKYNTLERIRCSSVVMVLAFGEVPGSNSFQTLNICHAFILLFLCCGLSLYDRRNQILRRCTSLTLSQLICFQSAVYIRAVYYRYPAHRVNINNTSRARYQVGW